MALTGLQIQKLLPKTNCKECGSNTCLAFAMKLAARKADIAQCPYASDEAKQVLGAAYEPPVKLLELGPERTLKIGEETVLYRHEKTFAHQTALAVNINDNETPEQIAQTLENINNYVLERVGEELRIDMVAVTQKGKDAAVFTQLAKKAWETVKRPLVLRSSDPGALVAAAEAVKGSRSVLASAVPGTVDVLLAAARDNGHILAVTAPDLNQLVLLAGSLKEKEYHDLLLQYQTHSLAEQFQVNTIARRAALKDNYKPLGYPGLTFLDSEDLLENTVWAVTETCKYGGICVLPAFDAAQLVTLMTLRLNIYTDPQKPIQVEPKLYPIGEPKSDSPVFLTTNFSLTYFIVSGEIENSGISAWLLVPECEGMSVLTAWAAGKFSGATIGKFAKEIGLESQVSTRQIVIPGYVSQISGELEENMHGWKVLVGPQDAADIESFIKARL
ncbi:MAG: acetyl-CoA decarbonylase/synthase complex subunit gamma [Acidobacteria bacterium]|jgi:acetyl-CoA decarbonylase/synthase complex subunit gamma|nr:acetyl-CoA decarbonylase/synthase complex subunit gamma [Acidobacteriota bacterium]